MGSAPPATGRILVERAAVGCLLAAGVLAFLVASRHIGDLDGPGLTEESAGWLFLVVIPAQTVGAVVGAVRQRRAGAGRAVLGSVVGAAIAGSLAWLVVGALDPTGRHAIGLWSGPGALVGALVGWLAGGGDRRPGVAVVTAIVGVLFVGLALGAFRLPGGPDLYAVCLGSLLGTGVSLVARLARRARRAD
jgi:hypothetical protein